MNILHISTADLRHGAGIAAYRLHGALRKRGVRSRMLVAEKSSDDPDVAALVPSDLSGGAAFLRHIQDIVELGLNTGGLQNHFSFFTKKLFSHPFVQEADIIHCHNLHWPFKNFPLRFLGIGRRKPLIWTLHDMWPLTGHCYHSFECVKWKSGCKGGCPHLFTFIPLAWDSTPLQWRAKKKMYTGTPFRVVVPSKWIMQIANDSPLLKGHDVFYIPNVADTAVFTVLNKSELRRAYGFLPDEKLILFAAANINVPLKGLPLLLDGLVHLKERNIMPTLMIAGNGDLPEKYKKIIRWRHFGRLHEDRKMAELYNMADMTIVPSAAENFPSVVLESMACATPVIGSRVGGIPDMIVHKENGWLFNPGDVLSLKEGIEYFFTNDDFRVAAGQNALRRVEDFFCEEKVIMAHTALYHQCLNG